MNEFNLTDNSKKRKITLKSLVTVFLVFAFTVISVGGVSTYPANLRIPLIVASGVITGAVVLFRRKKVFLTMPVVLILLTVVYLFISMSYTIDKSTTLELAVVYLCSSLLLLAEYPESLFEKTITAMKIVCIVIAVSIIMSSFIDNLMLDYFWFIVNPTKNPDVVEFLTQEINWAGSYSGFAREKGEAAFIMNVGISIFFAKYFSEKKFRISDMVFLLILFWALILTSKRMLFICPIATVCVLLLISKKKGRFIKILPVAMLALCAVIVIGSAVPQFSNLFDRFLDTNSMDKLSGRVYLWPYCFEMFYKNPLFGMGIGTFNKYLYNNNIMIDGEYWTHHGHNIYYEFLGELGIIGCVLLFGALIMFLYRTVVLMRSDETSTKQKYLLTFSCSVQLICLIYCASGNVLLFPQEIFPWFICLAITTTISNKIKRKKQRNTADNFQ